MSDVDGVSAEQQFDVEMAARSAVLHDEVRAELQEGIDAGPFESVDALRGETARYEAAGPGERRRLWASYSEAQRAALQSSGVSGPMGSVEVKRPSEGDRSGFVPMSPDEPGYERAMRRLVPKLDAALKQPGFDLASDVHARMIELRREAETFGARDARRGEALQEAYALYEQARAQDRASAPFGNVETGGRRWYETDPYTGVTTHFEQDSEGRTRVAAVKTPDDVAAARAALASSARPWGLDPGSVTAADVAGWDHKARRLFRAENPEKWKSLLESSAPAPANRIGG